MNGVGRVVAFNGTRYAAGAATIVLGVVLPLPGALGLLVRCGAGLAALWVVTSLAATWWVYDHKPLYGWRWPTGMLPAPPARYAVVTTGRRRHGPHRPRGGSARQSPLR
jgi:hypothetical protein